MRILIFFDLPTLTDDERSAYRHFRKFLIENGFVQMQESVYTRIVLNSTQATTVTDNIVKNKPDHGLVQLLTITEKQFSRIINITGKVSSPYLLSDDRLVIIGDKE